MKFAETEGTGISNRAESEGTCIGYSLTRTKGTGFSKSAETEGTGISQLSKFNFSVLALVFSLLAPSLFAAELRLYSTDQQYVKGIYTENNEAVFVEGFIDQQSIELISNTSLLEFSETDATGEGTGGGSTDATGEGTGGVSINATGEGTGGGSVNATGEGTGGGSVNATGEGTGGGSVNATGEGTGGGSTNATGEGTGGGILTNQEPAITTTLQLQLNCKTNMANGTYNAENVNADLANVKIYLNDQLLTCASSSRQ